MDDFDRSSPDSGETLRAFQESARLAFQESAGEVLWRKVAQDLRELTRGPRLEALG